MEMKDNPDLVCNPTLPYTDVDYFEIVANQKAGKSDMKVVSITSEVGGCIVEIMSTTTFQKGKRKGERKYLKPGIKVLVGPQDLLAAKEKWQQETGRCHTCFGNKLIMVGWRKGEGRYYRECKYCKESK